MPTDDEYVLATLTDSRDPLTMDELVAKTGLSIHRINQALCSLLLNGKTRPVKLRKSGKMTTHYTLKTRD